MIRFCFALLFAAYLPPMSAQSFSATQSTADGAAVIRLADADANAHVSIAPQVGNIAYEYVVNGKNALWWPFEDVSAFAKEPKLSGNPLLWPWANRLDRDGFFANGKFYSLRPDLGNLRRDGAKQPIHGLLLFFRCVGSRGGRSG